MAMSRSEGLVKIALRTLLKTLHQSSLQTDNIFWRASEPLFTQERGPRYVNNVAVFVKKGQKDIDANEPPCHVFCSATKQS